MSYRGVDFILSCDGSKEVLLLGSDQCSKNLDDGPINMAPQKLKLKSCEHVHELINMNHTMFQITCESEHAF